MSSLFSLPLHTGTAASAYGARPRRPRNPQGAVAAATPPLQHHTHPSHPPPKKNGDVFSLGSCPRIPSSGAAGHFSPVLKTDPTTGAGEHAGVSRCFFPPPTPGLCSRPVAGKVPVDGWPLCSPLSLSLSLSASRRVLAAPAPSAVGSAPPSRAQRTCTPLVFGICGCEALRGFL